MAADGPPDPALAQLAAAGLRVEADAADRSRAARDEAGSPMPGADAAAISAHVERIAAILGVPGSDGATGTGGPPSRDVALSALCRAEAARLEETDDASRWTAVADAFEAIGRPYPAAYARYRAGAAILRDRGARDDAKTALPPRSRRLFAWARGHSPRRSRRSPATHVSILPGPRRPRRRIRPPTPPPGSA